MVGLATALTRATCKKRFKDFYFQTTGLNKLLTFCRFAALVIQVLAHLVGVLAPFSLATAVMIHSSYVAWTRTSPSKQESHATKYVASLWAVESTLAVPYVTLAYALLAKRHRNKDAIVESMSARLAVAMACQRRPSSMDKSRQDTTNARMFAKGTKSP